MKLLNRDIKLVIFDLDGTLIDSTAIWAKIDEEFFARRNRPLPPTYGAEIAHVGLKKGAEITIAKYCPGEKEEDIIAEWKYLSYEQYAYHIPLKPYAKELLDALKEKGVKLAVATANSKDLYEPCLKRLQILDDFDFIIDVNRTKEGKNSSEIYDLAAKEMGVPKENVAIFEDLMEAMRTAFSAGYLTFGVFDPGTTKDEERNKTHCHRFLHSLKEALDIIE